MEALTPSPNLTRKRCQTNVIGIILLCCVAYKKYSNCSPIHGDQKIGGQITQMLEKVAKTVAEQKKKKYKISASKRNLKVQNIYINFCET
jgi:hypothetical protein